MKIKLTKEGQRVCTRLDGKALAHEGDVLEGVRLTDDKLWPGCVLLTSPKLGILISGEYEVVEE